MISDEYKKLLQKIHGEKIFGWGTSNSVGAWRAPYVIQTAGEETHILDYGSGPGGLREAIEKLQPGVFTVIDYEPGIPGKDMPPAPAPFVVCIDVLEHVEPEMIDQVLDELQRVTLKKALFTIALSPAKAILPDGRNAHILLRPAEWWMDRLKSRFRMIKVTGSPTSLWVHLDKL